MVEDLEKKTGKSERKILSPGSWFFYSFILWSIVIIPLSIAVFFILNVFPNLFDMGNQYSALVGLLVGIVLSLIVSFIYSKRARERAEKA